MKITYEYAIMAFRMYLGKIDSKLEDELFNKLYYLTDLYSEDEMHNYLINNKIL